MELGAEIPTPLIGVGQQWPLIQLSSSTSYIACESPFCIEKANTEIETTFNTTDVFTNSMQGLFYVSEQLKQPLTALKYLQVQNNPHVRRITSSSGHSLGNKQEMCKKKTPTKAIIKSNSGGKHVSF